MANAEPITLRIVAFKEGDAWAAQCLEYDIAAQGPTPEVVMRRMNNALCREAEYTHEHNGAPFKGIDPAPEFFVALYENEAVDVCLPEPSTMAWAADRTYRIAA